MSWSSGSIDQRTQIILPDRSKPCSRILPQACASSYPCDIHPSFGITSCCIERFAYRACSGTISHREVVAWAKGKLAPWAERSKLSEVVSVGMFLYSYPTCEPQASRTLGGNAYKAILGATFSHGTTLNLGTMEKETKATFTAATLRLLVVYDAILTKTGVMKHCR